MVWIEVIVSLLLIFSFIGGLREGAVKAFFSLLALFICIPLSGFLYTYLAGVLTFLHNDSWRNFIGFFITFIILSIIVALIFWIPSRLLNAAWSKGILHAVLGGLLSLIACALSIVLFRIILHTYPIIDWLDYAVTHSVVINWLTPYFSFIRLMLPEVFHGGTGIISLLAL